VGPIDGGLDGWVIEPSAIDLKACRVRVASNSDNTVHFSFDLPGTSADAFMSELEAHTAWVAEHTRRYAEIQQLSEEEIAAGLRKSRTKLEDHRTDKEGRLEAWWEDIFLRKELFRRHPVRIPPDILKGTLSRYHLYVATAGRERLSFRDQEYMARTALNMQRTCTPEARESTWRKTTPSAMRIWLSLQPEYDGRFDPDALRMDINNARGERTYAECLAELSRRGVRGARQ
jgi:hypothetical protein